MLLHKEGGEVKAEIKLAYKLYIDHGSKGDFERNVFHDSYSEYLIQVQSFDKERKYKTWQELRTAIPKANLNVQYKTGFAIGLYVRDLGGQVPGLTDILGRFNLPFESHSFEIIESDFGNISSHKVAITFITESMILLGIVGDYMILARADSFKQAGEEMIESLMVRMQPNLSVVGYREIIFA